MMLFGNAIKNFYGTVALTTPGGGAVSVGSSGGVVIGTPAAGTTALTVNTVNAGSSASLGCNFASSLSTDSPYTQWSRTATVTGFVGAVGTANNLITGSLVGDFGIAALTGSLLLSAASGVGAAIKIASSGAVSIASAAGVNALTVNQLTGQINTSWTDGTVTTQYFSSGGSTTANFGTTSNHPITLITNSSTRQTISAAGNISIAAPSSGVTLAVSSGSNSTIATFDSTRAGGGYINMTNSGAIAAYIGTGTDVSGGTTLGDLVLAAGTSARSTQIVRGGGNGVAFTVLGTGAVTIATPSSGTALTVNALSSGNGISVSDGTNSSTVVGFSGAHALQIGSTAAFPLQLIAQGAVIVALSSGVIVGAPTGGDQGAGTLNATALFVQGVAVPSPGIPQNSQSANYTLVLSDANKHIYHPSADTTARTWTIPANGSVAMPIGTAVTFDNDTSAGVITLAITTDTLVWLPTGATGSRSIAANGQGTALKVTATRWHLTGVGIS